MIEDTEEPSQVSSFVLPFNRHMRWWHSVIYIPYLGSTYLTTAQPSRAWQKTAMPMRHRLPSKLHDLMRRVRRRTRRWQIRFVTLPISVSSCQSASWFSLIWLQSELRITKAELVCVSQTDEQRMTLRLWQSTRLSCSSECFKTKSETYANIGWKVLGVILMRLCRKRWLLAWIVNIIIAMKSSMRSYKL